MNILPKKRWHVRTKDNIARVRRDEAEAAEQERKRFEKQKIAETESRLGLLRSKTQTKSRSPDKSTEISITKEDGHVDLFSDFQAHTRTVNKEHEKEKKEEKEKSEKQIGYLTYLGQDTNEALKLKSWYEIAPNRGRSGDEDRIEKNLEKKRHHDPMSLFSSESVKKQKHSSSSSKKADEHCKRKKRESSDTLGDEQARKKELMDKMRRERIKREERERLRQEQLFAKPEKAVPVAAPKVVQKYHSQFNPHIARQ